jgi:ADP-ribose pyrophosphatase YjhB (NUDIX family)
MSEAETNRRRYPERPIPAVGGVVLKGRDVLLVMRGKEPGFGEWSIPGGAILVGESLREALVREIREEVDILVDPVDLLDVLDRIVRDDHGMIRYHYILLDFLCLYRSGELKAGSDAMKARWVKSSDLRGYRLRRETEAIIRKGLAMAHSRWERAHGQE